MDRFARIVLGYHGNTKTFVTALLDGTTRIVDWPASKNAYDWLGEGIYFWEHAPERALRWAKDNIERRPDRYPVGASPAVIGAVIQLSPCFDLTNIRHTEMLAPAYDQVAEAVGEALPKNRGGRDKLMRDLDCVVINWCLRGDKRFLTVRGAFWEGEEVYPGAGIMKESHIQIAVRDPSCILGVFRPNLEE